MNMKPIDMYIKDNTGALRVWSIEVQDYVIIMTHGQLFGSMQYKSEEVLEGKGGRTREEQIMSRMASRISKQRDKGYTNDIEKARSEKATNTLNLKKPMLARKYSGELPVSFYLQPKYDGNRCLITKQNGKVIAYSRNGKLFQSIDHILEAAKNIPEGMTLDGELYCHGVPLQTLRSWIAKKQAASNGLVYMCYDVMLDAPYKKRLETIKNLTLGDSIKKVLTPLITPLDLAVTSIADRLKAIRLLGYEGLIARHPDGTYEDGKRSKYLIKIKDWHRAEYMIIDIVSSVDNWARLVCITADGKEFKMSAPGTIIRKEDILRDKHLYIGRTVTGEYANLTKDGVPFHPTAIAIRDGME